jgi:hypothetical protein
MPTPLREAALAEVVARLAAQLPGVTVERARRATVDTDNEALPRVVVRGGDWLADNSQEPGITHWTIGVAVSGFAGGADDLAAEQALSDLHARVVAALAAWTPAIAGLGDLAEENADLRLYDADESAKPAGEFVARFSLLAIGPSASPYTP